MSVFGPLDAERRAILANQTERDQQATFLRSLAEHPAETWNLVNIISQWGDHAPTLPAGAILGLAHAGLGPHGPVGESVIRNGVPALAQPANALDRAIAAITPDELTSAPAAAISQGHAFTPDQPDLIGDPNYGSGISGAIQRGLGAFPGAVGEGLGQTSASLQSIGGTVGSGLQAAGSFVNREAVQPINRAIYGAEAGASRATPNSQSSQQIEAMGLGNPDVAKTAARELGAGANDLSTAVFKVPLEASAAAMNQYVMHNPAGSTYNVPFTGAHLTVGSLKDALSPEQFDLYQQSQGESLGQGMIPGGPAVEAAGAAQHRAGMINGHALTTGRVIASTVFEPGSRPYQALSGPIDFAIAMELDPTANLLKYGSEARAANRLFTAMDEPSAAHVAQYLFDNANSSEAVTGLHAWAGSPESDLVGAIADKVKRDPGSAMNLAQRLGIGTDEGLMRSAVLHKAGVFVGLRPFVHPPTALQWMASRDGGATIDAIARESSFTRLRSIFSDSVPVDLVAQLSHADTPEAVRSILSTELGPTVDGPFGYRWWRPPEQTRLWSQMPKGSIDLTDGNQQIQQAQRIVALTKMPIAQADPLLEEIAGARTMGGAANAWFKLGDAVADHLVNLNPDIVEGVRSTTDPSVVRALVGKGFTDKEIQTLTNTVNENTVRRMLGPKLGDTPPALAKRLTHFFQNEWEQQHKFNTDSVGQVARGTGISADGEGFPLYGPHLESELARYLPPLDYRALRQASQKWRQTLHFWNDGYLTDPEEFAGGAMRKAHQMASIESWMSGKITSLFKMGVLSAPRVMMRITGEEQLATAVAGIDSMFTHPLHYIATALGGRAAEPTGMAGKIAEQVAQGAEKLVGTRATINPLTGRTFASEMAERGSNIIRSMGQAAADNPSPWKIDQQAMRAYVDFSKNDPAYLRSWAGELSTIHSDALGREVAQALLNPEYVPKGMEEGLPGIEFPLVHKYTQTDVLTPEGRALVGNHPLEVERLELILEDAWNARLGAAIRRVDEANPETDSALLRATERDMKGTTAETPDILNAEYKVHMGRLESELRAAGGEPDRLHGLDAVKEWYSTGAGQPHLASLRDADLNWGSRYLNNRLVADLHVDSVVDRAMVKTGGDPILLDTVANGTGFNYAKANQGIGKSVSGDLRRYLAARKDDLGPDVVKGRPPLTGAQKYSLDRAADFWIGKLMDAPSRLLTRSPFYRQWSYKETQRLMPFMTDEAQMFALKNAAADSMTLTKGTTTGLLDAEQADAIVKARTLARMKDYLYYPGEKTTAEDIMRNISPFAPAWHSVVKRWSKLTIEHPQVLRRAQQGVQEMQTSGFTYRDPQTGKDVFSVAGPEWVKGLTGAVGFDLQAPIQGLNIVGNGLPGIGVGPQIAASAVLPKTSATAGLRAFISPYGDPDFAGWQDVFFPGWLQKMQAGGFQGIPVVGHALRTIIPRTPSQTVTVQDLQKQALTTMMNSGLYDPSKPGVLEQMYRQSEFQANRLMMLRGLVQMMSPTAPSYSAKIAPPGYPTGLFLYKIATDYRDLLKKNNYDYQKTNLALVHKWGANVLFATEPKNLRTVYGIPTSVLGEAWQNQHSSFVNSYPNVWGYFAPQGGTFSQTVYHDQIARGLIQPLTVRQFGAMVEDTIGSMYYDQLRKQLGDHVTRQGQAWLDQNKLKLAKQFPGYGANVPGKGGRAKPDQIMTELAHAIQDPVIATSAVGKGIGIYLDLRQQALTAAGRKTLTGPNMAASRAWLYENGTALVKQYPELSPIWDSLFQREVVPQ